MRLELGASVLCEDGVLGELADVVIDPTTKRVTHLVVEPHDNDVARLVSIDLAQDGDGQEISLRCTAEDVRRLAPVHEFAYLRLGQFPVDDPDWDVGIQEVLAMPYYEPGLDVGSYGGDAGVIYDRVPKGEVEVRRASAVTSADGHHVGHVDGFVTDGEQITHLVLERGHLWGRREVTIPIGSVEKVETDAVTLGLTKDEVGGLDSIPLRRWRQ
jgi:sporulation protein YlmC with PRC-barrel domain